jgi:antitoxin component of MazEF toxin-antitoxin module
MQARYALKVQAIRSKGQRPRLYVYMPHALAEAIGLQAGEAVCWEVLDRGELHLVRRRPLAPRAKHRATRRKR